MSGATAISAGSRAYPHAFDPRPGEEPATPDCGADDHKTAASGSGAGAAALKLRARLQLRHEGHSPCRQPTVPRCRRRQGLNGVSCEKSMGRAEVRRRNPRSRRATAAARPSAGAGRSGPGRLAGLQFHDLDGGPLAMPQRAWRLQGHDSSNGEVWDKSGVIPLTRVGDR